jgi:hypothetical protein
MMGLSLMYKREIVGRSGKIEDVASNNVFCRCDPETICCSWFSMFPIVIMRGPSEQSRPMYASLNFNCSCVLQLIKSK